MKPKELAQLLVAVVILAVAGYIIYLQLSPHRGGSAAKTGPTVEKITPIPTDYDQSALDKLTDTSKVRDFYNPPDLTNGLGNTQPFGPLR